MNKIVAGETSDSCRRCVFLERRPEDNGQQLVFGSIAPLLFLVSQEVLHLEETQPTCLAREVNIVHVGELLVGSHAESPTLLLHLRACYPISSSCEEPQAIEARDIVPIRVQWALETQIQARIVDSLTRKKESKGIFLMTFLLLNAIGPDRAWIPWFQREARKWLNLHSLWKQPSFLQLDPEQRQATGNIKLLSDFH